MSAEMSRLHEHLSVEKLQATLTVEQLRELPEQANELRSQLQDHAMALGDQAGDLYQDLVARGERVVESRRQSCPARARNDMTITRVGSHRTEPWSTARRPVTGARMGSVTAGE